MIVTGILTRARYDNITALRAGLGISATKGGLSLVVAKGGQDVGAISQSILPILGVITIVTTFIGPFIIRVGSKFKLIELTEKEEEKEGKDSKRD